MTYDEAKSVECPACRAPAGSDCCYVENAEHNGWAHVYRYDEAARRTPEIEAEITRLQGGEGL